MVNMGVSAAMRADVDIGVVASANKPSRVRWGYPSLLYNARRGLLPPRQQVAAQGRYYIGRYEPIFREIMFSLAAYIALGTSSWVSAVSEVDAVFHVLSGVLEIP